ATGPGDSGRDRRSTTNRATASGTPNATIHRKQSAVSPLPSPSGPRTIHWRQQLKPLQPSHSTRDGAGSSDQVIGRSGRDNSNAAITANIPVSRVPVSSSASL